MTNFHKNEFLIFFQKKIKVFINEESFFSDLKQSQEMLF